MTVIEPPYRLEGYTRTVHPHIGGTGSIGTLPMSDDDKESSKKKKPIGFIWSDEEEESDV